MFNTFSKTGVGAIALFLTYGLQSFGFDVDEGVVTEAVTKTVEVIGFILVLYGQWQRQDLHIGLVRK